MQESSLAKIIVKGVFEEWSPARMIHLLKYLLGGFCALGLRLREPYGSESANLFLFIVIPQGFAVPWIDSWPFDN